MCQTWKVDVGQSIEQRKNQLLAALPAESHARLSGNLESVFVEMGMVLYEPQSQPHYLYFPVSCVVSVIQVAGCSEEGEVTLVGHEGVIGTALFRGGETSNHRVVVRRSGMCYRILSGFVTEEFIRCGDFMRLIFRYLGILPAQTPGILTPWQLEV
jgi:hypothetical protein